MNPTDQLSNNQTEIILKVDIEDLRDIYFSKRQHIYFFGPQTKDISWGLVAGIVLFPLVTTYSLNNRVGGMFIFSCIVFISLIYGFWQAARPIIAWKKSVHEFLKMAENVKSLKIIFNENFILHIQDEEEIKLNWDAVKYATISQRSISICSDITNMLLPKSSMSDEEYSILSDKVMEKVQEVQKI